MTATAKSQPDPLAFILKAGPLLYGRDWQKPTAEALGVSARHLRQVIAGSRRPQAYYADRLRAAVRPRLREKEADLAALRQLLAGQGQNEGED